MIERIEITVAASKIGYSIRTFRRWCTKFGVEIFHDPGFKKNFVLKCEFEAIADYEPNKYLLKKYGSSEEINNNKIPPSSELIGKHSIKKMNLNPNLDYHPKYVHEIKFLSSLTESTPEL